ncbi:MAG TPA: response regulator [Caulobacteraceae bacterium]|jgi:DNA-binding NtrC family response regulator|nr:response regulator [Caulobacteraceae bacterium]
MRTTEDQPPAANVAETVLVVDDDVLVRASIAAYLRECGYRVIEANGAEEAMLLLDHDTGAEIGAVLTDIEMAGGRDGFVLAQWIRTRRPDCDVILAGTPARAANAAGELCEKGPMLAKPYETRLVLDHIRQLMARRRRRDPDAP